MLRSRVARVTCAYIAALVAIFAVWYSTDPAAAAQRSQRASSIDTGGLQVVVSIVQGNPELFGGLWVDENTSQVHVATAAPGAAQLLAGSNLKIIFDSVDRSTQQLESVRSDLTAALDTDQTFRDLYQYDVVDVKTNVVTIGLRQLVPTEIDKLKGQFGESISIVEAADTPKAAAATRLSDTNPFIAGDRVNNRNNGLVCTLGFTARRPDAVVILTAGHCGVRNDVIRTTSENVGHVAIRELSANGWDGTLLVDKPYAARMWVGPINSSTFEFVVGTATLPSGSSVCANGSVSGTRCDGHVSSMNGCYNIDYTNEGYGVIRICHLDITTGSSSNQCQGGDSGGPLFLPGSGTEDFAVGIIIAAGGQSCFYHEISPLLSHFGASLSTS